MEIDKDLELADEWAKSLPEWCNDGWRATCKRLADEVRRLRAADAARIEAQTGVQRLQAERNRTGLAVMRALNGIVPADHPMAGVLNMAAEAGKDAARYRWLRNYRPGLLLDMLTGSSNPDAAYAAELDAEIDAAMGAELSAEEVDALLDASEVRNG